LPFLTEFNLYRYAAGVTTSSRGQVAGSVHVRGAEAGLHTLTQELESAWL
jgi:hypothetical protein